MARLALPAAAVALLAVAPTQALAADHTIRASNYVFTDAALTITAGDRVNLLNVQGLHNYVFEDGSGAFPPMPTMSGAWPAGLNRVFPNAGTFPYYCAAHVDIDMRGTITVTAPPPPDPTPSPQPGPSPSPSPGPGGGGGGGTSPTGDQPARVHSVALAAGSFCARRGPNCRRPGVRLRIDLSAPARVTGVLKRRAKRFGRVDLGTVAAGPRTLRFQRTSSGRRLTAGRFSLALSVDGAAAKTLRFRIR